MLITLHKRFYTKDITLHQRFSHFTSCTSQLVSPYLHSSARVEFGLAHVQISERFCELKNACMQLQVLGCGSEWLFFNSLGSFSMIFSTLGVYFCTDFVQAFTTNFFTHNNFWGILLKARLRRLALNRLVRFYPELSKTRTKHFCLINQRHFCLVSQNLLMSYIFNIKKNKHYKFDFINF